jgi:hypothetical protein
MTHEEAALVEKLQILSENRLADILKIPREGLASLSTEPRLKYGPFMSTKPPRPFQKLPPVQAATDRQPPARTEVRAEANISETPETHLLSGSHSRRGAEAQRVG